MTSTLPRMITTTISMLTVVVSVFMFTLIATPSAQASAREQAEVTPAMTMCVDAATIQSLRGCVKHMTALGIINSPGIAHSLLAKLDAAQKAVDRDQPEAAEKQLKAFIHEVRAQAGKHIAQPHAGHLILHAQLVLQAIEEEREGVSG